MKNFCPAKFLGYFFIIAFISLTLLGCTLYFRNISSKIIEKETETMFDLMSNQDVYTYDQKVEIITKKIKSQKSYPYFLSRLYLANLYNEKDEIEEMSTILDELMHNRHIPIFMKYVAEIWYQSKNNDNILKDDDIDSLENNDFAQPIVLLKALNSIENDNINAGVENFITLLNDPSLDLSVNFFIQELLKIYSPNIENVE